MPTKGAKCKVINKKHQQLIIHFISKKIIFYKFDTNKSISLPRCKVLENLKTLVRTFRDPTAKLGNGAKFS